MSSYNVILVFILFTYLIEGIYSFTSKSKAFKLLQEDALLRVTENEYLDAFYYKDLDECAKACLRSDNCNAYHHSTAPAKEKNCYMVNIRNPTKCQILRLCDKSNCHSGLKIRSAKSYFMVQKNGVNIKIEKYKTSKVDNDGILHCNDFKNQFCHQFVVGLKDNIDEITCDVLDGLKLSRSWKRSGDGDATCDVGSIIIGFDKKKSLTAICSEIIGYTITSICQQKEVTIIGKVSCEVDTLATEKYGLISISRNTLGYKFKCCILKKQ